jgi:hypothetical protein
MIRDFDQDDVYLWDQAYYDYNAAGENDRTDYRYDDGSRMIRDFDQDEAYIWDQVYYHYDSSGNRARDDYRYDDATRKIRAYDSDDSSVLYVDTIYDGAGELQAVQTYLEDGSVLVA